MTPEHLGRGEETEKVIRRWHLTLLNIKHSGLFLDQFNSIQLKFISIQQRYKTFYKVYIYIEFVLQFVRNNTKWIMEYITKYIQWIE